MPPDPSHLHSDVLRRVLAMTRHLGASADLKEILGLIIDAMRDLLHAERATVFEYDARTDELFTTVAHGMGTGGGGAGGAGLREIRIPASKGLAGECAQSRSIINVPDAYADPRFNQAVDRQTGYRTRSILTIPLIGHDGELVGVAQTLNKDLGREGGRYTGEDEELAAALAAQAAVAMKRARLLEDRLVRLKLERDLELARTIQQSSFPAELPPSDVFDVAAWNQPAEATGGDAYDVVRAGDRTPGRLMLLMADATGHGVGPAISVTQLRSMLRMATHLGADVAHTVRHCNQQLCADLPGGRFITAWIAELDETNGSLTAISAGQAPLLHYHAADDRFETMGSDAVPFGVLDELEFATPPRRVLRAGDIFAAISDGIFEARDPDDELMGQDRVIRCLREVRGEPAAIILEFLRREVDAFCRGREADDDRTAIIVKRRP